MATDMLKLFSKNVTEYLGFALINGGLRCVKLKRNANNTVDVDYFSYLGPKALSRLSIEEVLAQEPITTADHHSAGITLSIAHKQTIINKVDTALTSRELVSYLSQNFTKQLNIPANNCHIEYRTFNSKSEKVVYGVALNARQQDFIRRFNSLVKLARVESNFCTLAWLCERSLKSDNSKSPPVWALLYANDNDWVLSIFNNGNLIFDKLLVAASTNAIADISSQVYQLLILFHLKQPAHLFVGPNLIDGFRASWAEKWTSVATLKSIELPSFINCDKYDLSSLESMLTVAVAIKTMRVKRWS